MRGRLQGALTPSVYAARSIVVIGLLGVLAACAQLPHHDIVTGPTTAEPVPPPPPPSNGSAFQMAYNKPLFEDRQPRHIGDILTVVIDEKLDATKSSAANASREGSIGFKPAQVPKAFGSIFKDQGADISASNDFEGKGGANASNAFNSRITVTVRQVLPNSNLKVAGEKQIGINRGTEYLLFSGTVDPRTIRADSTVTSTQVADARLEYYGKGYISEAEQMGWLQRLILNLEPF
jgi:flagellar L-ring protein precursor FlgH